MENLRDTKYEIRRKLRERGNFDGMELHMTEPQHFVKKLKNLKIDWRSAQYGAPSNFAFYVARLLMHPHALHFTKASWIPAPGCCATDNFACRLHHFTEWLADPSFSDTEPEPGDKGEMVWAAPPGRWWRLALPMHPCPGAC